MKKAHYNHINGTLVTPIEFFKKTTPEYKSRGIFPYCASCHEIVHLYGVNTPNPAAIPRFDHANLPPDTNPLDDCILANRNQRFKGLEPDGWDEKRGLVMRKIFFENDNLAIAYAFCLNLSRKGNLPKTKFISMLDRADQKRVWAYDGIPLWSIPYILLTLENFSGTKKSGGEYAFHFSFNKPKNSTISSLWKTHEECQIIKLFSENGHALKSADNPYPVSEKAILKKAGDTSWMSASFLQSLTR